MARRSMGIVSAFLSVVALLAGLLSSMAVASASPDTDEAQVKELIAGQLTALQAVDAVAYGATYCADRRDKVESDHAAMFTPPSAKKLEGANAKKLRAKIKELFPVASSEAVEAFVQAVADVDQGSVDAAWHQLWVSSFAKLSYRVKTVKVTGDSAVASVAVRVIGGESGNARWDLTREDGQWKDCTPSSEQDSARGLVGGGQGQQSLLDASQLGE
ncbi:hypothetical protein FZI91_11665 [Mycobacterium sp. CBMA271]|uniref:hypothetical protein n=1 Tax=unclassified Mycobacteroides TaxID=2618759 RepID=UPI0012DE9E7B|nr:MULTISPECIES: hypothetical protein [unclassified Mycobacteroides]MUM16147.1 hypothetical protein [Mycobacteroides sp. CBMA 326]MUM22351.1 hypothetical protein [Mycobacteroides sp. CBMA 271]